jgi:hypothetical protein
LRFGLQRLVQRVERLVSTGVVATTGVVVDEDDLVEVLEVLEILVLLIAVEVGELDVGVVEEDEDDGVVDVVGAEGNWGGVTTEDGVVVVDGLVVAGEVVGVALDR